MSKQIEATVEQVGPSTSLGKVRTHEAYIDRPLEKGGSDQGPMGGDLILMGLGGCFMSNLLAAIAARGSEVHGLTVKVTATLEGTPERMTRFDLTVRGHYDDEEEMRRLVTIAERGCIAANTLGAGSEINVTIGPERRSPARPPDRG